MTGSATNDEVVEHAQHGVAYPEWPETLGAPRLHLFDALDGSAAKTRAEIVAQLRRRRPEAHAPVAAKQQIASVRALQESTFPARQCSFQVQCRKAPATRKCHQCVKFDERRLGFYCDACFDARHPPYRMAHAWVPIEEDVNHEESWIAHVTRHNLEQDAEELQLLLTQTQSFLRSTTGAAGPPTSASRPATRAPTAAASASLRTATGAIDFARVRESVTSITTTLRDLMEQIHSELAKKPLSREEALVKIQTMWRIRKARKQMKELLASVYQSFEDPSTGTTYYYNARTKTTQWTKPKGLETAQAAKASRNQSDDDASASTSNAPKETRKSRLQALATESERREFAARCIQGMARAHSARRHMRKLISSVYEKIWDPSVARFYYHNTKTKAVKWDKPRWVSDADLLTPRARQAKEDEEERARQRQRIEALRSEMTEDSAARMMQRAYRRRRGFAMLLDLCRSVYERVYDAEQQAYYYHNTRTKEVSWDKPLLLRRAAADVYSPRSRQKQLERVALLRRPRREYTDESAAVLLQGLFRARCARRELDQRLAAAYKKVWDPTSERFYYANLQTGAVSWERPAILVRRAAVDVEEL